MEPFPKRAETTPISAPRWLVFTWLFLILGTWAVRGLPWHLNDYDQAKQAYTSYEMIREGHWWRQHTPRMDPATKPPLAGWVSAGLWRATGSWDLAWRLPSWLAAAGILILLWKSGKRVAGDAGAFVATGAFAWNMLSLRMATLVRTDMLLTALIFGSGWIIWNRLEQEGKLRMTDLLSVGLLLGAAAMTKGPIYHAFLLPSIIVWALLVKRRPSPWKIPAQYLLVSLISVLPFLFWVWWCIQQDKAFYNRVVVQEFLGRFSSGDQALHVSQPWYFYLPHLLMKCAPWSLGLIAVASFKNVRSSFRNHPATLWLVCWALGGLVVMSLIPSKRVDRIMPVLPVFALLLATSIPSLPIRGSALSKLVVGFCVTGSLVFLCYTGFKVREGYRLRLDGLGKFGEKVQSVAASHGWKIAVSGSRDEGMLIYLGQTRFLRTAEIATKLLANEIDAAVVDDKALKVLKSKGINVEELISTAALPARQYHYHFIRQKTRPTLD